jgi:membrane protease subunit HflK
MPLLSGISLALNDPQWGRGSGSGGDDGDRDRERDEGRRGRPQGGGPPDLDELWRDLNRRLNGLFGKRRGSAGGGQGGGGGGGGSFRPDARGAGVGVAAVLAVASLIWLGSGAYIVQEGQVGVVTTFGRYSETTLAGFRWRLPWPVQSHEIVDVLSVRTLEIGARGRADRLKEALMLTDDENIVDLQFTVQYRIKEDPTGARDFVFNNRRPTDAVGQVAESVMREVVGSQSMDQVLYESRQEIADAVRTQMQDILDRYGTGIRVLQVAIQNAQPPEQVQAAFDDAVKATQDRERLINEGQAYANDIIPRARGTAARLLQEAEGHRTRVVQTAEGDGARFRQIATEYGKAPQLTRERLYLETMQQIFANTSKVLIDSKSSSPLLYLPFDKLLQQSAGDAATVRPPLAMPPEPAATEPKPGAGARGRETR